MTKQYSDSLQRYGLPEFNQQWSEIRRGIEKESLRVSPQGHISPSAHPHALGSALTNPFITTDFSEALLEFITPVHTDIESCLAELDAIHRFALQNLDNEEMLWVASMPCPIDAGDNIPIAQYGSSNIGKMKTLYRKGLTMRYGALMQIIAGLHYNFSMPESFWPAFQKIRGDDGSLQDFRTNSYLHLIRNFHRNSWLLLYLFGASPAACKCFVQGREHRLQEYDACSLYLPDATCLRMGDLGYRSDAQNSLFVCYNELDTSIHCLHEAMHTSYAEYEKIGQEKDGEYQQINTNLLQLENEFYSNIRPKPNLSKGQRPLDALRESGIEYVEVRALDLNPYLPLGIDAEQIRFLDTFLLHCLLAESPVCDRQEFFEVSSNIATIVERGRSADVQLKKGGDSIAMKDWAAELLEDMQHSAALLDSVDDGSAHGAALAQQVAKLADPGLTPSGRLLSEMQNNNQSFFDLSLALSKQQSDALRNATLDAESVQRFVEASTMSHKKQSETEAADTISFPEFLRNWNAQ